MAPEANTTMSAAGPIIVSSLDSVPITKQFHAAEGLDKYIPNSGQPRANRAVSKERPEGDPSVSDKHTVLQQHVLFWDRDGDGIITPWDTFVGFRRLGFNLLISTLAVPFIHGSFSYPSSPSWIPDPLFRIYIKNMHRTKHGSDTGVYDTEGRFVPQKFEDIFAKFDKEGKGALSWDDIQAMVHENMNIVDPTGWTAERLEWWVTWLLLKDSKGLVSKEKIRGVYDGSIWPIIANEVAEKKRGSKKKST